MKTKKLNQILISNKLRIVVTILFILGLYHLLMSLVIGDAFDLNKDEKDAVKFILIRFYHVSYTLLIGLGFSFKWAKNINWIWIYLGFRLTYTISRLFPLIDKIFSKTLMDGLSFGLLIIVVIMVLRDE